MSEICDSGLGVSDSKSVTPHITDNTKLLLLYSFGHQYGAPQIIPSISTDPSIPQEPFLSANHLIDARVLPNPPRDIRKQFTGLSTSFQDALLLEDEKGRQFYDSAIQSVCDYLLSANIPSGPCVVKIGVGCRMGKHRSVATVECLARDLPKRLEAEWRVVTRHRDLKRIKTRKATADTASESDRD